MKKPWFLKSPLVRRHPVALAILVGASALHSVSAASQQATPAAPAALKEWPRLRSAIPADPAIEQRIRGILSGMTLAQKVGQMTQPEIKSITPDQVREYYIGSVLNGGGSWPGRKKDASVADWLALATRYYEASMATDLKVKIPVIWGTDAVHGHNNVRGATIFPHNIGLGAARDPGLVEDIGRSTGRAVRATGIQWVFGPTLAVAQDIRWGRTYESFSDDPVLVKEYAARYTRGLQGRFDGDANAVATAKHFIGDGGTAGGKDQGVNHATREEMINVHGAGYFGALEAGAQTVMASFNSWRDPAGVEHGKMHGNRELLTDALKVRMGFDGFVVSDWNGIAQIPGCSDSSCAQAIKAGIDMVMVPDDWRNFIANTIRQVERGEIPMERIDDAVTRILRVKLRAGLFNGAPAGGRFAGSATAVVDRALARDAVRKSLVLLKNNRGVLPLTRSARVLVVGKSANSMQNQTGGWTLTWQGTENTNADFPNGDTILDGMREHAGAGRVVLSENAAGVDVRGFDAVIAVIGESPYAEGQGDIVPSDTLRHTRRHPEDLAVLRAVSGRGVPVVTVFVSGRPAYVNDLINLSDAFVAAWLPGTEGKGVADVMYRAAAAGRQAVFQGKLPFNWPGSDCGIAGGAPAVLFKRGYGLDAGAEQMVGELPVESAAACAARDRVSIFPASTQAGFQLLAAGINGELLGGALSAELAGPVMLPPAMPRLKVENAQIHTQQDARRLTWLAPAVLIARAGDSIDLSQFAKRDGVLRFDVVVSAAPNGPVTVGMECGAGCRGAATVTRALRDAAGKGRKTISVPLKCLAENGADLSRIQVPFRLEATAPLVAAFTRIEVAMDGSAAYASPASAACPTE